MSLEFLTDTPMHRTSITEMTHDQAIQFIETRREQRMRQQRLFEQAQEAAKKLKAEKDKELLEKRLIQIEKKAATVDKGLEQLSNWINEIQILRMTVGDLK